MSMVGRATGQQKPRNKFRKGLKPVNQVRTLEIKEERIYGGIPLANLSSRYADTESTKF